MLPGIVIVTIMALLMNATGIELDTDSDLDLDQELRSVGLQNLAAGAGGGVPGYPAVSLSLLAAHLGATNRRASRPAIMKIGLPVAQSINSVRNPR